MGLAWQQGPPAPAAIGRRAGEQSKQRAARQHAELPDHASELKGRVAFGWRAMDAFYEEDDRIVGHAAKLRLVPGQTVIAHGADRNLSTDEVSPGRLS